MPEGGERRAAWIRPLARTPRLTQPCNVADLPEVLSQPFISLLLVSLFCLCY